MDTLDIRCLKNRNIKKLSGGEYQKVAIAQVLIFRPKILLLDEPTAGIDTKSASMIEDTIKNIQRASKMLVIMTTHSLNQAYRMSHDIVSISNGRIVDFIHENVFSAEVQEKSNGLKSIKIADNVEIVFATEKSGHIIGHSLGGSIAQLFAVTCPEKTVSVTAISSPILAKENV